MFFSLTKKAVRFFDKLEDKVRGRLSHWPILYAFIAGFGIVTFWRGAWHTCDTIMEAIFKFSGVSTTIGIDGFPWWDGPLSLIVGSVILLLTGAFVTNFIGNEIIISGLKGEKKLAEKSEIEVKMEVGVIHGLKKELKEMTERVEKLEESIKR